ncbi:SDR family oxidoreductase [uncultured Nostoc sp.]|uniref:SDR family oxidoreductase n=1 Tax=uncultured Nostoc sp. TaxID=340711 RepID=UPI0035CC2125
MNNTLNSQQKTIFLTGGSGVFGQALLTNLNPDSFICLSHRKSIPYPGVNVIQGDLLLPQLGLSNVQLEELAQKIDGIVHAAAITDFGKPDELIHNTNVRGLENIIEFAKLAQVPLYYISTAFVRPNSQKRGNTEHAYIFSKREAEKLLRESEVPHIIIRPSIIIGDSMSGCISRFQGFYNVAGTVIKNFLPILPALSSEAYTDLIPQDVVANAVFSLINARCTSREYWICSGEKAPSISEVIELVMEFAIKLGYPIKPPKLVSFDSFERLLQPTFMSALPTTVQKGFKLIAQVSPYMSIEEPFSTSLPEIEKRFGLSPSANIKTAINRSLEYWGNKTRLRNGC